MNDNLHISADGLNFIKNWEGCILHVYNDVVGVATIGVGHALLPSEKSSGIYAGGITLQQALDILANDVRRFEDAIKKYVLVELNQNQFDALVSMTFNVGTGVLVSSGLIKALNSNNYAQVPTEMLKWCKAGGQVNQGLLNRRKSEAALFSKAVAAPVAPPETIAMPEAPPEPVALPEAPIGSPQAPVAPTLAPATSPWQIIVAFFLSIFGKK